MKVKKIKSKAARTLAVSSCAVIVVFSLGVVLSKTIVTDSQELQATRVSASNEKTNYKKSTEIGIVDTSQYNGEGALPMYQNNEIDIKATYVNVKLTPSELNQLKNTQYPKVKLEVEHDSNTSQIQNHKLTILEQKIKKQNHIFIKNMQLYQR